MTGNDWKTKRSGQLCVTLIFMLGRACGNTYALVPKYYTENPQISKIKWH